MKKILETTYNLPAPGVPGLRILVLSDIHFAKNIPDRFLHRLEKYARNVSPDYILIPGDFLDTGNAITEQNLQRSKSGRNTSDRGAVLTDSRYDPTSDKPRFYKFLRNLGQIAPTLISVGNHDCYLENPDDPKAWFVDGYEHMKLFFAEMNEIENVCVLDNQTYEDDRLYVAGLTLPWEYYQDDNRKRSQMPNIDVALQELAKQKRLLNGLPKAKVKIASTHSPEKMDDSRILKLLSEFDYSVFGHMHCGAVFPLLERFWPGQRGIIGPSLRLFPRRVRNTCQTPLEHARNRQIVVGAVTTFSQTSGATRALNFLFPKYTTILNFSDTEFRKEKRYLNFS